MEFVLMEKVIIHPKPDGGVMLFLPTGELSIEEVLAKDCPEGSIIIEKANVPIDSLDFYDAWEFVNGKIEISLEKAKEVTRNRLRDDRISLLQAQDVLFQRALETGADTSAIVAEKERLRNITTLPDSATSLAELRSLTV